MKPKLILANVIKRKLLDINKETIYNGIKVCALIYKMKSYLKPNVMYTYGAFEILLGLDEIMMVKSLSNGISILIRRNNSVYFNNTKIENIQGLLECPLCKDNVKIHEVFKRRRRRGDEG